MILVPGLGDKKVKRLYQALHEPFRSVKPKNKDVSDRNTYKSSSSNSGSSSSSSNSSSNSGSSSSSSSNSNNNESGVNSGGGSSSSGGNITSNLNIADVDVVDSNVSREKDSVIEEIIAVSAPT